MMEYNMPYQHSIIIGNYNDFNFFPSILLDFKENKYFEMYFQNFIIDGYDGDLTDKVYRTYYEDRIVLNVADSSNNLGTKEIKDGA